MRISMVLERFDPHGGGAERATAGLSAALAGRGHEVTVFAGGAPTGGEASGARVVAWRPGGRLRTGVDRVRFRRWARRVIERHGGDAALSLTTAVPATVVEPRAGLVAESLARSIARRRSRVGRRLKRAEHLLSPRARALLALERRTMHDPSARRFVAISGYMEEQLRRHYDVVADAIPNAVEMASLDERERRDGRRRVVEELGLRGDETLFLFPALDPARKGIHPLLRAVSRLRQVQRRFVVLAVGPGARGPRWAARRLGVDRHVRWLGKRSDMRALYGAADGTVLPTYYDPASRVVLESLLAGVPVVTTPYNGAAEWIEENTRGHIVAEPDDVEALADAMRRIAANAGKRVALDGAARDRLTLASHARDLETLLEEEAARGTGCPLGNG